MNFSEIVTQIERYFENHDYNKAEKIFFSSKPESNDTYSKICLNYLLGKVQIGADNANRALKPLLYTQKELSSSKKYQKRIITWKMGL